MWLHFRILAEFWLLSFSNRTLQLQQKIILSKYSYSYVVPVSVIHPHGICGYVNTVL